MCYAIPAKLIEIKDNIGIIDYFGEKRRILLDLDNVKVGDYIYAQGGISIRKIPTNEALDILDHWKTIFFELKKTDEILSKLPNEDLKSNKSNALRILQKINLGKTLKKEELLELLKLEDPRELKVLYAVANNIRQRKHGNSSCIHGIIEFSNYCQSSCLYCGINKNMNIKRYRMAIDEIINIAKDAVETYGFKAILLQSGEDLWYDLQKLQTIVTEIKKLGVLIFLSIGMRDKQIYEKLYEAGARAALMRFETSNKDIFEKLKPGNNFEDRIELIKYLKKIGYILATGFMIGLPEEQPEDIINNILLNKYLDPDMHSFGPFIPTIGTPLSECTQPSATTILKTIAVTRFAATNSNILVTTALESLGKDYKKIALSSGANSLMINITPKKYKHLYNIYDNKADVNKDLEINIKENIKLLKSLGRAPTDISFSLEDRN